MEIVNVQTKLELRGKEIGEVHSPKILYESKGISRGGNSSIQVNLEVKDKMFRITHLLTDHLYKEDHYEVGGKKVKIISSVGSLHEVLSVIDHIKKSKIKE